MEDPERGVESLGSITPKVRESAHNPGYFTIVIIRSVGKIRSFKISQSLVRFAALFLLFYLLASVFIINDYIDQRRITVKQLETIEKLETGLSKSKNAILRSQQHLALLEDYIHQREEEPRQSQVLTKIQPQPIQSPGSVETGDDSASLNRLKEQKQASIVLIKDIVLQKNESFLIVDFKLVNAREEESPAEGYLHILAKGEGNDIPLEWTYPKQTLQNGLPNNFRRGLPFFIQRFKPYHREFRSDSNAKKPSAIKILIYDQSGTLLLEKYLDVNPNIPQT